MVFNSSLYHLLALILTLSIEGAGMTLWARASHLHVGRAVLICLLINLVVHTLFWLLQPFLLSDWPIGLYRAELLVVIVEGAAYAHWLSLPTWRPWLVSLILNALSLCAGLWLWQHLQ